MSEPRTQVRVDGDVWGQVVVGDHNVVVTGEHSMVTVLQPGQRPRPERRETISLLPRRAAPPRGRDRELAEIAAAAAAGEPLQIHGDEGCGKSTVVRRAARQIDRTSAGTVFLNAAGHDGEDVAQNIFEACYDSAGYRPGAVELQRLMTGLDVRVVIDDLEEPAAGITRLLDQVPDAAFVMTSSTQSLWGHGRVLSLRGLAVQDGRGLLADVLDRALLPTEAAVADALWEATGGNPLQLVRAAAAARPQGDGVPVLPRPGELADLLPRVLEGLPALEREAVDLLALVGTRMSADLLGFLLRIPGRRQELVQVTARLAALGLADVSEQGCRPARGLTEALSGESTPTLHGLAGLVDPLTEWVSLPHVSPETVAEHGQLVTAVTEAAALAGRPAAGARLAAAAAPAVAYSLRWSTWRQLLDRGRTAAESAGDRRLVAYFTHEDGIRSLLTGKRLAAATALGIAAALWAEHGLDGTAEVAQHAQELCGPMTSTPASGGTGGTSPDPNPVEADPGTTVAQDPGATSSTVHSRAGDALTTKTGIGLTGKLALGAGLAGVVAGGTVLGINAAAPDTVPIRVKVASDIIQVTMPGEAEPGCRRPPGRTDCTTIVKPKKGSRGPISVQPDGPLPRGVVFLYWGCSEGAQAKSCTVRADRERSVCVTTSSPKDAAARAACGATRPSGGNPAPATVPFTVVIASKFYLQVSGAPGACGNNSADGTRCEFQVRPDTSYTLRAMATIAPPTGHGGIIGDAGSARATFWRGCDAGYGHGFAISCVVKASRPGRTVCVTTADPGDSQRAATCDALERSTRPAPQQPRG